jgi:MarR family transcriptional regulator, lower aerobic nicotinate degradation pathway regulator
MTAASGATAAMNGNWDDRAVPERLRSLPSRMLGHTAACAERLVGDALAGAGARKWHYALLLALREAGPGSQSALSRRTGIYTSDLVAVINELADRGHVERAPDPADRRRNVITITARGRRHLGRLDALIGAAQEDLLAPLDPREREEFTRLLRRLLDHHLTGHHPHDRHGARPAAP